MFRVTSVRQTRKLFAFASSNLERGLRSQHALLHEQNGRMELEASVLLFREVVAFVLVREVLRTP